LLKPEESMVKGRVRMEERLSAGAHPLVEPHPR
jgi:hypothetical protein